MYPRYQFNCSTVTPPFVTKKSWFSSNFEDRQYLFSQHSEPDLWEIITNSSFRELSNGISHEWSVTSFTWSTLCTKFEYVKKIMLYTSPSDVTQPITSPVAIIIATTYFYLTPNLSQHGQEWGRALGSCHEGRSGQRRQWHSRHSGSHYSGFVPVSRVIDMLYCRQQTLVTPSPHALINFITMLKLQTQQSIGGTTISLSNQRVICKTIAKINL